MIMSVFENKEVQHMKQNEKQTVKGVISIEEYLKKRKENLTKRQIGEENRKSSALMLAELYI